MTEEEKEMLDRIDANMSFNNQITKEVWYEIKEQIKRREKRDDILMNVKIVAVIILGSLIIYIMGVGLYALGGGSL